METSKKRSQEIGKEFQIEDLHCNNCGHNLVAYIYLGETFDVSSFIVKCPKCSFEYMIKGVIVKHLTEVNYGKRKDV